VGGPPASLLVAIYKDPQQPQHAREFAAKAALPYEKARPVITAPNAAEPVKVRSELEIGRRLAFVLELIARGEVKAKMPKDAPLLEGLEVPERDLAGREFATSQIASHCRSELASLVPSGRPPQYGTTNVQMTEPTH